MKWSWRIGKVLGIDVLNDVVYSATSGLGSARAHGA